MVSKEKSETLASFQLDEYRATHPENQKMNGESRLLPADHRPFGVWFQEVLKKDMCAKEEWDVSWGVFFPRRGKTFCRSQRATTRRFCTLWTVIRTRRRGTILSAAGRPSFNAKKKKKAK